MYRKVAEIVASVPRAVTCFSTVNISGSHSTLTNMKKRALVQDSLHPGFYLDSALLHFYLEDDVESISYGCP